MATYKPITIARFWSKVAVGTATQCWPFCASCNDNGYGRFRVSRPRRIKGAHVVAWEISTGLSAEGYEICHHCDNPPCCNPRHLFRGTGSDNMLDAYQKGRLALPPSVGIENGNAHLTERDVHAIRRLVAAGEKNTHIAPLFNVTHSMVSRIKLGKSWRHLPQEPTP